MGCCCCLRRCQGRRCWAHTRPEDPKILCDAQDGAEGGPVRLLPEECPFRLAFSTLGIHVTFHLERFCCKGTLKTATLAESLSVGSGGAPMGEQAPFLGQKHPGPPPSRSLSVRKPVRSASACL